MQLRPKIRTQIGVLNIVEQGEKTMPPKNQYDEKDAAEETDVSEREVKGAWHNARTDCQNSDDPYDQHLTEGWGRDSNKGWVNNYQDDEDEEEEED